MNSNSNPCGLDGFAFLEFSGPDKTQLAQEFSNLGFQLVATHQEQDIDLYQQNNIQFIVNAAPHTQAAEHSKVHGAGPCAMGFKTKDAQAAFQYVMNHGAEAFEDCSHAHHGLPAIKAIGGSVIYFVDDQYKPFEKQWHKLQPSTMQDHGLLEIDHLTHNVLRGTMEKWAQFYEHLFNFHEIRFFNIQGTMTGLVSRALSSPCGKIKIPLNESKDDQSQIEEFLREYQGEGIQHMALSTNNIYKTVHELRKKGLSFLDVPDTYYEMLDQRLPWHQEPVHALNAEKILIDGELDPKQGLLLQIFTEPMLGPVFFEIIQRKGNQGFGEGNFQALFEAMERDQMKRGTLKAPL